MPPVGTGRRWSPRGVKGQPARSARPRRVREEGTHDLVLGKLPVSKEETGATPLCRRSIEGADSKTTSSHCTTVTPESLEIHFQQEGESRSRRPDGLRVGWRPPPFVWDPTAFLSLLSLSNDEEELSRSEGQVPWCPRRLPTKSRATECARGRCPLKHNEGTACW